MRGATLKFTQTSWGGIFLLTHLLRGATVWLLISSGLCDFYSRTSCEVRREPVSGSGGSGAISTHAPLARCDCAARIVFIVIKNFYSRTSCEVRLFLASLKTVQRGFLLTHLLRGATESFASILESVSFLLTHLLRGATFLLAGHSPLQ